MLVFSFPTSGRKRVAAFLVVKANILLHNPQQVYKPGDTPHLQNHLDVQNVKTSTFSVFVGLYIMKYSQGPELRWYLCQLSAHQHEN